MSDGSISLMHQWLFQDPDVCKVIHFMGVLLDEIKIELEEPTSIVEEWCYTHKSNVISWPGLWEELIDSLNLNRTGCLLRSLCRLYQVTFLTRAHPRHWDTQTSVADGCWQTQRWVLSLQSALEHRQESVQDVMPSANMNTGALLGKRWVHGCTSMSCSIWRSDASAVDIGQSTFGGLQTDPAWKAPCSGMD